MTNFALRVTDNQSPGVYRGNLRSNGAYGLQFSTQLSAGCAECSLKIPYTGTLNRLVIPSYLGYNYRLDVLDGGEYIWSGRIEDVGFHKGADGYYFTVKAKGYGVNLGDQMHTSYAAGAQSLDTVITNAITTLSPQIRAYNITATGFTLSSATVNLQDIYAGAVIAWAARYGNTAFSPQQWHVYPDPTTGAITFSFLPRPTSADVEGFLADFVEAEFALYGKNAYNRAQVRYNAGASYATRNNTTAQAAGPGGWGLIRELRVVLPEITSSVDAQQAGDAMLTQYGTLRMAATTLRTPAGENTMRMVDSNGIRIRPWKLKAGQLFRFRDVDPADVSMSNLSWSSAFVIAGTSYNEDTQTLDITPEGFDDSADKLLAKVDYLLRGRFGLGGTA